MLLLCSTLGERNPNTDLDGLPVLYKPRSFEISRSWTAIFMPLLISAGAGLVFESVVVAVVTGRWSILADFFKI